ncbi:hypothetical protein JW933_10170 [candidate division FCPU426 bacterium]|nr:hypothetical protein [candidate division FCPU426 bacterium]
METVIANIVLAKCGISKESLPGDQFSSMRDENAEGREEAWEYDLYENMQMV